MSSVFQRDGGSGPACVAVNGRTDTMWVPRNNDNTNCVHTNEFDYAAFWLVDLGRNYTVTDITVFRRKGDPLRMSGMSVFVDNQLCYSFLNRTAANIAALNALPERINITCPTPLTGRQVRFQKHGWDRNFDPGGYILNICEVQVWACKDGLYGAQCDQTCSGHCKDNDTCDNYYGTCPTGCSTGYRGADCRCGHCRDGADCDVTTLRCLSGCDKGWDTQFCNQSCTADTHGYDCGERCGQCADGDTCNTVTGLCPNGCQPGWQGNTCKQKCADGYYGQRCMSLCGNCSNSEMCDKVTGTCPTGCQPGFDPSDPLCKTPCPRMQYGARCSRPCGQCQNNAPCEVVAGRCDVCQPNLLPPFCQVCEGKMYGAECDKPCSAQCGGDGSCHRNDATCQAGCVPGYLLGSGFCEEKMSGESSPNLAGPVAGALFGGLCVIALSILVGLLIRRSRKRSSSETASPTQASHNQSLESGAPVELNGQVSLPEKTGSAGGTDAEESHIYDGLQTPDDSDRAPYATPVFKGKQDKGINSHTYQNSALHNSDTGKDYYNL
ncbi:hypothetical protein V1264_021045 [Littorina saxatilis]|uniref:EGF-like domain-containing protein n=1 Tax=Littorina saxatilis TaxID=31220 RepID=A0AAN9GC87_9CAEN